MGVLLCDVVTLRLKNCGSPPLALVVNKLLLFDMMALLFCWRWALKPMYCILSSTVSSFSLPDVPGFDCYLFEA